MILLPLFALLLSHTVRAQQYFLPTAIPLAVRSPYLNCWLQTRSPTVFGSTWPTSFNLSQVCHPCTVYLNDKFSAFHVSSDPRVVCPRTCRWPDIFVIGGCTSEPPQRYRQHHECCVDSYTVHVHCASWAHATQPYLPESYRGSFSLACLFFNIYIHIILSPKIGSSNPSHSRTWLSPQSPRMAQLMLCRCIQMSVEVRASSLKPVISSHSPTSLQSGTREIDRRQFCGLRILNSMLCFTVSISKAQKNSRK